MKEAPFSIVITVKIPLNAVDQFSAISLSDMVISNLCSRYGADEMARGKVTTEIPDEAG